MARMFALTGRDSNRLTLPAEGAEVGGPSRPDFGQPPYSHREFGLRKKKASCPLPLNPAQRFTPPVRLCFSGPSPLISAPKYFL